MCQESSGSGTNVDSGYAYYNYEQADPPHQPLGFDQILRHLKLPDDIVRVLDVGCGDGNCTASVAEAGFQMFGLDQSSGGIAKATQRYPNIRFFGVRSMTISYPVAKLMRLMQSSPSR